MAKTTEKLKRKQKKRWLQFSKQLKQQEAVIASLVLSNLYPHDPSDRKILPSYKIEKNMKRKNF